ncbi:MAG: sodium:proton exchanger [Firmicutes bacterium]|nr:sodium:proton exchanger [Bacillota bacterium]
MNWGILSLLPSVLAIVLAVVTRSVTSSLFIAVLLGSVMLKDLNPVAGFLSMIEDYFFKQLTSTGNAQLIIQMSIIGGFVALVERSGGAMAFGNWATRWANSKAKAQLAGWLMGLVIFFSDSANCLLIGPVFRPIFDRIKCSREKLAYIIDSTASPVCCLIPFIGWGVYNMGLIAEQFKALQIAQSEWDAFVSAIPYQFYALLTVVGVALVAIFGLDMGAMLGAEKRVQGGQILRPGSAINLDSEKPVQSEKPPRLILMAAPLITMMVVMFAIFVSLGFPTKIMPGMKIRVGVTSGFLCGSLVAMILVIREKVMTFHQAVGTFVGGIKNMAEVLTILVLAWSLGGVTQKLGAANVIVEAARGILSPALIPAIVFIFACIASFATGSSWGVFAIFMPLAIPLAHGLGGNVIVTIGAVLSGGLLGDHCSPISDTTIMSAMSGGVDLVDHTVTQLPYALTAAAASLVAYILAGYGMGILTLPVALVVYIGFLFIASRSKKAFGKVAG